jgi:prolyl-tRNA synthetase
VAYDSPLPNGKTLQIGTTHHLGNSFAKAFDVKFLDEDGETKLVYQTSYGISTRLIASVLSLHGDDQGLILPPSFAPTQVIIVPITFKDKSQEVIDACVALKEEITSWNYRVHADLRDQYTPGWKFSEWEMQGVPIRVEIGPRDLKNNAAMVVRRDTGEKEVVPRDQLQARIAELMQEIFDTLKQRADETLASLMRSADTLDVLLEIQTNNQGIVASNWCGDVSCADTIKEQASSNILGERHDLDEEPTGPCLVCGQTAKFRIYIASAY